MQRELHFKNREAYRKWRAYMKIHHLKEKSPGSKIIISGKLHKVKHTKVKSSRKLSKPRKSKKSYKKPKKR